MLLAEIEPAPGQTNDRLRESLRNDGQVVPLVLGDRGDEPYAIVDGRARVRALRWMKAGTASAMIYDWEDVRAVAPLLRLRLNALRSDDEPGIYRALTELARTMNPEQIARAVGLSCPTVRNYLALGSGVLPEFLEGWLAGRISDSAIWALSKLSPERQADLLGRGRVRFVDVAKAVKARRAA